jgi:cysteinyl-tRNA synthetase
MFEDCPMVLHLYDTLAREEREFVPRAAGKASIYVCGPTVYSDAHVGHGRAAVVFDVLRRHLMWSGLDVTYVQNITDVDDKIILRAARQKTTPAAIATTYTLGWNASMHAIGVLAPTIQPMATGHLLEMHQLMQDLIDKEMAYEAGGNVLFRVSRFKPYGQLSGRVLEDMVSQEDVVGSEVKEDPRDFAMWKAAKPGEPQWPSPWGPGRPGWHIECSAMAGAHLGGGFDIHGGGFDLVFPHHENEAAQFEAAYGGQYARHWMHNGMVRMGEEKMSKSIGNIVSLDQAVERWGRGPLRLWYLSAHHRSPLTFDESRLADGTTSFERLVTFARTVELVVGVEALTDAAAGVDAAAAHRVGFTAAMDNDLNAPQAVAVLHAIVSDGNDRLGRAEAGDIDEVAAVVALRALLLELADDVLGLALAEVLHAGRAAGARVAPLVDAAVERRATARAEKDFAAADAARDELAQSGVVLEDRPTGPRWFLDPAFDPTPDAPEGAA